MFGSIDSRRYGAEICGLTAAVLVTAVRFAFHRAAHHPPPQQELAP
jgi:hypothetical protein